MTLRPWATQDACSVHLRPRGGSAPSHPGLPGKLFFHHVTVMAKQGGCRLASVPARNLGLPVMWGLWPDCVQGPPHAPPNSCVPAPPCGAAARPAWLDLPTAETFKEFHISRLRDVVRWHLDLNTAFNRRATWARITQVPHPLTPQNLGEQRFASPQRKGESWLRPSFT